MAVLTKLKQNLLHLSNVVTLIKLTKMYTHCQLKNIGDMWIGWVRESWLIIAHRAEVRARFAAQSIFTLISQSKNHH